MKLHPRTSNQSGDTIVEVLIAIAVVSAVLMGAFLVTSKSVIGVRNGQEHGEMLQVLQGQVEHVRAIALDQTSESGGIFAAGNFCVDASNAASPVRVAATNAVCHNIQNRYNVSVSYNTSTKVFTFIGTWDALGGGTNREQLNYRIYSGASAAAVPPGTPAPTPTPGVDGDAFFSSSSDCGTPSKPVCPPVVFPPNGHYYYGHQYTNESNNDPAKILGCTWDWGDGTVEVFGSTAQQCQYGGLSNMHSFPPPQPLLPYPQSCTNQVKYTVVLTMRISGVSPNPKWIRVTSNPYCGA